MARRARLELSWIGKDTRPKVEPRILLRDDAISYRAARVPSDGDQFDNVLVHGDNLLALRALERDFAGRVKCVFIDPPYNTGSAFVQYDDGLEHSVWLSFIRDRLEVLHRLMSDDGSIWITIDDNEAHYLKVLADEVFGRSCFVASVVWRSTDNSNNDAKQFSVDHNYVLVYSKRENWRPNTLSTDSKRSHFRNPDNDPRGPWFDGNPLNSPKPRPNLTFDLTAPNGNVIKPPKNGWRWSPGTMAEKIASGEIRFTKDGKGIRRRTYLADMEGLPPSTLWSELEETGHNRQAKYELKGLFPERVPSDLFATPKPERLLARVLEIATAAGDLVLDSFAGSGTTGAVAHKMGRRWIMVEVGEHCYSDLFPRMRKVVDGNDAGGISEDLEWKGGGGFRGFRVASSLLERDDRGNWIISKQYNPAMLSEAVCKHEGFRYEPSSTAYWQHGRSTETDFIYVTTQTLTREQLEHLSHEVGDGRTLLVCCGAFRVGHDAFANLTLKKIPNAVLDRCEWGRDDYSLAASPPGEPVPVDRMPATSGGKAHARTGARARPKPPAQTLPLFAPEKKS